MKLRMRTRLLRRLVFASVLAALLYSVLATTRPAAAQYPYGCDCTRLYSEAYTICQNRGGLSYFSCSSTYNGYAGSIICGDGSRWTNSCTR
jgi:hypothetical protein